MLGLHYAVPWPHREMTSGRDQRRSPLHDRLAQRGAWFGTRMGWERPNVFTAGDPGSAYTWGKPPWLDDCLREQRACRTEVAVFDQTSFSKYAVSGPGALASLQWVCAADVDVPVGACVYTPWLGSRGTYEADLTVTRTALDEFLVVSSSATTVRDLDWLQRHRGPDTDIDDLTDDFSVIGVMGPASRDLLGGLTDADLSEEGFPFATSRALDLAGVRVRATRMTYVGETGWELVVPVGSAGAVYDAVAGTGGATDAGYYAIEALRLEKGYRAFGRELTPDHTPVEAGLVFATALSGDKDFLGREALEAHRRGLAEGGARRRIVSLVVSDPEPMLWGGSCSRDGEPCGQVTSAAWGATVGASVGLGLVRAPASRRPDVAGLGDPRGGCRGHDVPGDAVVARAAVTSPYHSWCPAVVHNHVTIRPQVFHGPPKRRFSRPRAP